ncbi:MAG: flagellar motor protein MotB [Burkholderiaceae bacterium]
MSGGDKKLQPIIVKKIKKGGHGHHGGAWKIAYADFVTAMMAFFLLMWLLGSTTKGDLRGISDFFNTPLKVALRGGSGSGDSSSIIRGGGEDLTRSVGQVKRGDIDPKKRTRNPHALAEEAKRLEGGRLKDLQEKVQTMISNDPKLSRMEGQIRMQLTVEGLRIQIVDDQNRAMFPSGKADVQPYMQELLRGIGGLLNEVRNPISISGHTDSLPFAGGARAYSNWELSTDRANASRRELVAGGLAADKVLRVVGMGPAMPLVLDDPRNPVNRRIAIVVLTEEAAAGLVREPAALDIGQAALEQAQAKANARLAGSNALGASQADAPATGIELAGQQAHAGRDSGAGSQDGRHDGAPGESGHTVPAGASHEAVAGSAHDAAPGKEVGPAHDDSSSGHSASGSGH